MQIQALYLVTAPRATERYVLHCTEYNVPGNAAWRVDQKQYHAIVLDTTSRTYERQQPRNFFLFFFFLSFFLFHPIYIFFALLFSLPPSRNSDPGSHSRLFSPPPHCGSCLAFLSRADFSSFFPRRLASTCAYPR